MKESIIETYFVKQVKAAGHETRKLKWIAAKDAPDRVLMVKARKQAPGLDCAWCNPIGRTIWVELKATGEKPRASQLREHERMRAAGQTVVVIDSKEGVDKLLEAL
jgi:hypothetical protein